MTPHERKIFELVEQELQNLFNGTESRRSSKGTKKRKPEKFKLDEEVYLNARTRCNL
jgi:hypothetical protein